MFPNSSGSIRSLGGHGITKLDHHPFQHQVKSKNQKLTVCESQIAFWSAIKTWYLAGRTSRISAIWPCILSLSDSKRWRLLYCSSTAMEKVCLSFQSQNSRVTVKAFAMRDISSVSASVGGKSCFFFFFREPGSSIFSASISLRFASRASSLYCCSRL
jgi:hypothetical protein